MTPCQHSSVVTQLLPKQIDNVVVSMTTELLKVHPDHAARETKHIDSMTMTLDQIKFVV